MEEEYEGEPPVSPATRCTVTGKKVKEKETDLMMKGLTDGWMGEWKDTLLSLWRQRSYFPVTT